MQTYLLKWNPDDDRHFGFEIALKDILRTGAYRTRWSCGVTKRIKQGDRVFMLRTAVPPAGIIASGHVIRGSYPAPHRWDPTREALFVDVELKAVLDWTKGQIVPVSRLTSGKLAAGPWRIQGSGKTIPPSVAAELEQVWAEISGQLSRSSANSGGNRGLQPAHMEGAPRQVEQTDYERNPKARRACIEHYGYRCYACGFDFEAFYGAMGRGFIHVHHLEQLSKKGRRHEVDPVRDLRPVCPNCHAMIHAGREMLSMQELKALVRKHGRRS
jgi:5-methylcytosine-specific restriction protein A